MSNLVLSASIIIHEKPKKKSTLSEMCTEFPTFLKFEYQCRVKFGKVGDITVTNTTTGETRLIKPHQTSALNSINHTVVT